MSALLPMEPALCARSRTSKITRPATRACSLPCSCTPLRLQRIPADGSVRVGSIQWDDTAHDVFIFQRLSRFMMFTGFRLVAEIVNNGSGEIMFLTYGRLFWCVDHVMIAKPSRALLLGMRPARDGAVVFPPRSPNQISGGDALPVPGPARLRNHRAQPRSCPSRPRASRWRAGHRPEQPPPLRGRRGAGLHPDGQHRASRAYPSARARRACIAYSTATASATSARAATAAYLRRASGPPPAAANHCATRRRRGRSSQPLAGLPMQRARRRGVDNHHTPRPQINKPESLSTSRTRAMVGPMKTSCYHSTISEWPSSNRPDFPPASPCGNREFWADVPHRNRDHQTYGAVRRVHSFFPYNVTDARRWVLCAARYVFLQRTFKPRGDRVGALGGQYGRRSTPRQLRCHRPTPRQLRV